MRRSFQKVPHGAPKGVDVPLWGLPFIGSQDHFLPIKQFRHCLAYQKGG